MSEALKLAIEIEDTKYKGWRDNFDTEVAAELRRLAPMEAELAALRASLSEPVAVIGPVFTLCWAGGGPIAPIVEKHGLKVGSPLYALKE